MYDQKHHWSGVRIAAIAFLLMLPGCAARYTTPGAGIAIPNLSQADADIAELMKVEPAASFPARMTIVRVQAAGYKSTTNECYGAGNYCVVTTRDIESDESFERIGNLPGLAGLAPMNRLLLPSNLASLRDLRVAAATLKTDLVLVYTLDTGFNVDSTDIGPLTVVSLGFIPNKKAKVTATASAVIFDVRTGFIYGLAETTAAEEQRSTVWETRAAIDEARIRAEKAAFEKLVGEIERVWADVVSSHASRERTAG